MSKKVVALLPMKANSERVKGKNFRNFCGKPLYKWMLDKLLSIDVVEKIAINTDARSLLIESGLDESDRVVIRDRKPEICGDFVSMNKIIEDDINNLDGDVFLMTHTTNPLLSRESIAGAVDIYFRKREDGYDSLFSVNKIQTRFYSADGAPINHNPGELVRTQDLEPWYEENSNLYIFSKESFRSTNARIGSNPFMYETKPFESTDIDTPPDWELAEVLMKHYGDKGLPE